MLKWDAIICMPCHADFDNNNKKRDTGSMEKVTQIPASPLDFFLLPVWLHRKISIRLPGLLLAFMFVGCLDLLFYENLFEQSIFAGNPGRMILRFFLFMALSFLVGAIDVIFTMWPVGDFLQMIGRRSDKFVHKRISVILMKSYALSHILFVIPYALVIYSGVDWAQVGPVSTSQVRVLYAVLATVLPILPFFQLGILYRTISVRTRIQTFGKMIAVLAAYFWMQISGTAITFLEGLAYEFLQGKSPFSILR
ncbi:MAG TPA: hypothetical protein PK369_04910 [Thermoclostridium sp.]|nr:hypothetical protein [Thermoclostridium sp.]HPU45669.1 hypothetical protein [Thermoclostridium sp.]